MPKSWLVLSSVGVSLVSVMSLHLSSGRPQIVNQFEASLHTLMSSVVSSHLWSDDGSSTFNTWKLPSYQDYVAAWQAQQPGVTLELKALELDQATTEAKPQAAVDSSASPLLETRPSSWVSQFQRRLTRDDRPESRQYLKPIFRQRIITVGFQANDDEVLKRYANRHHLSQSTIEWRYFDPAAIERLSGQRRVITENVVAEHIEQALSDSSTASDLWPQHHLEVAPGGGQYWIEDPNAAWW